MSAYREAPAVVPPAYRRRHVGSPGFYFALLVLGLLSLHVGALGLLSAGWDAAGCVLCVGTATLGGLVASSRFCHVVHKVVLLVAAFVPSAVIGSLCGTVPDRAAPRPVSIAYMPDRETVYAPGDWVRVRATLRCRVRTRTEVRTPRVVTGYYYDVRCYTP